MRKNNIWQAPIPKTPKFNQRRMLYKWYETDDSPYLILMQGWLTHAEVTMMLLKGYDLSLIQNV